MANLFLVSFLVLAALAAYSLIKGFSSSSVSAGPSFDAKRLQPNTTADLAIQASLITRPSSPAASEQPSDETASSSTSFETSVLVSNVTDNPTLGYLAGGSIAGAIIGYELAELRSENQTSDTAIVSQSGDTVPENSASHNGLSDMQSTPDAS